MRAIAVERAGAPLALVDLPEPRPGPGELRLKVRAAGVNPFDLKAANGVLESRGATVRYPLVLGLDVVGRVEEVGEGATGFAVGEEVFGLSWPEVFGHGTYAEQTIVPASTVLAKVPEALAFEIAAELPMPAGTALELVDRKLGLERGQVLGVVGAAGAVGSYLVQLASRVGIQVVAVARGVDRSRLEQYGAARVVERDRGDVVDLVREAAPRGLDAIVDMASDAATGTRLAETLKPGGRFVSLTGSADIDAIAALGAEASNSHYLPAAGDGERLASMVVEGELLVPPRHETSLDGALDAVAAVSRGETRAKLVIVP